MASLNHILSLARSGSPVRAWALFVKSGWEAVHDDPKALTLKGRLLKDRAKLASNAGDRAKQLQLYAQAADAYSMAADIKPDSYPLINAASLALLSGKPGYASHIASKVTALIENNPDEGENTYWRDATIAEALLLMNYTLEAKEYLSKAISILPDAWEDHAATLSQFEMILSEQGNPDDWLDRYRPPCSLYYSGIMSLIDTDITDSIDNYLVQERPAFAYGSLAAGSDILCAKSFLHYKKHYKPYAQLHIILPFPVEQFCELSVVPFGEQWVIDFEDILAEASSVHIMGLDDPPHDVAVELANKVAMGQALRNARNLRSYAKALTVNGKNEDLRPHLLQWQDMHHDLTILGAERLSIGVGAFEEQNHDSHIRALLWLEDADFDICTNHDWHKRNGSHYIILDDMKAAYDMVRKLKNNPSARMTILYDIMDKPSVENLQRAKAMAELTEAGTVTCDYNSAMALTFDNIATSVEEIGELKTIWGSQSFWSVV